MNPAFNEFLQSSQQRCDTALTEWMERDHCGAPQLLAAMKYSLLSGGKRVRPLLTYAAAMAVGGINTATDAAACALEAIHAYSLIHDDLPAMDDDDLRRGQPTCHIAFDEATAILAGDGLQALAFELLATAPGIEAATRAQLMAQLATAAGPAGMVGGQAIDLAAVNQQLTLEQLQHMHNLKTGALIKAAVLMGAISAGASEQQLTSLARYADAIGLAFQVQDDILDVVADTSTLGKPQGSDISHNKPTYVSLLGLDGARAKARDLLNQALAACDALGNEAEQLRQLARYIVERGK
ncbi:(2E,6E)-farnesyl diphosphate synthase [Pseudomaricurvus sp. HS19]|uniref:(2E,6E)-farnesyl diphosphate synthase n=1 Tax=Pseudomaricurvus sp. HS19 TaxID=2692626 RepID=UPI00136E408A|nr:farnesyl diphosphate synthase [Pseudomaricurvus sp. HS19]MYM64371.1 (2E,6E)-farnesyl diphosphate synthase [Pseudomaricurvus sp. HS19]